MNTKRLFLITLFIFGICNAPILQAQTKKTAVKYATAKEVIAALMDTVIKSPLGINSQQWLAKSISTNKSLKADIDKWMGVFGEALTDVQPWKISTEIIAPSNGKPAIEINFTTKNNIVYVLVRGEMRDMMIKSLAISGSLKAMETIKMLGSTERISWEQQEHALTLEKPEILTSADAIAFKITFQDYYKSTGTIH